MSTSTGTPSPSPSPGSEAGAEAGGVVGAAASGGSLKGTLILAGARLLGRLPEAPLVAAAESIGELWYRAQPARAAQARRNLRRVCEGLAAQGRGTARARRAATDPDALERLVRACFRHAVRYYLEVARAGAYTVQGAIASIEVETPAEVNEALRSGRPIVLIGMHYGAIELPIVYVSDLVGHAVTAPMELVADPGLRRWFVESRSRVGVGIVPLKDARRALLAALRRGESIGMINDRDITGTGIPTPFFGHDAPISPGPALLAVEAGVPVYVGSCRRNGTGRYIGRLIEVPVPTEGSRRERMTALTNGIVRAYEDLLADGPEQWWGAFHPIWPDLAGDQGAAGDASRAADTGTPVA